MAGAKRRILIGRPPPDLHDILFEEGVLANLFDYILQQGYMRRKYESIGAKFQPP
jgi:hypothetical protein